MSLQRIIILLFSRFNISISTCNFALMNRHLNLAVNAAKKAGDIILSYYKTDYDVRDKSYHNPVTTADFKANESLIENLTKACPDYGWFSEETTDSPDRLDKEYVWIVDPLDGTKEFIEGIPNFVVSIALVKDHTPVMGVLYNPVTKELFYAEKGQGAFLNDKKIWCSEEQQTKRMIILNSRSETRRGLWDRHTDQFKELRPVGSVAYKLGLTAAGKADIFASLRPKNEWDIAAGHCIITEAGGVLINLNGQDIRYNQKDTLITPGLVAGNPSAVEKTINYLTIENNHE